MKYRLVFFLIALIGLALDLVTKSVVFHYLKDSVSGGLKEVNIIPGVFQLSCVENTGIIWGLFPNTNILIFIILAGLAVPFIILMFFLIKHPGWLVTVSLGLILAGALGNLYDRIVYHAVRDFLDFYLINWPKFNIADVSITIGAILIIFTMLKPEKNPCSETPEQGDIESVERRA